nr:hypothetical protein [Desulfobacula sp.]
MEKILIDSNGSLLKAGQKQAGSILKLLGNPIELDKAFTLRSFFGMIRQYPELKNISEILDSLLEIISKNDSVGNKINDIESLVFYKTIEIRGFPGKPELTLYNSLKGVTRDKTGDLKFFQPEALLDHTLTLGKLKHIIFGDREDIFEYETVYTLFELVEGVAWELSFNFNPLQCSIRR